MHGSRIPPPQKGFPSHSTTLPSTLLSEINVNAPAVYHDFTYLADELVNRTPTGASVAEPDSVIGESGRLYHGYKEGKYFFPNDAAEQDRLDFQHTSITLLLDGKLTWAPMTKAPKYVMDVATGTGIWAIEFANQNPSSQVVGTDLSKIQPENAPANCTFEKEDSEEEWLYSHKFDYVHLRAVFSCFDNPKMVMRHAFQNLNPGGWIEYHDGCPTIQGLNGCLKGEYLLQRWSKLIQEGAKALGRDIDVVKHYKRWLIETGFVDVEEKKLMWPLNPWPRGRNLNMVGRYQQINFSEAVRPVGWKLLRGAGLSPEEVEKLTSEAKREIPDQRIRAFISFYVVYGRKPFEGERKGPVFGEEDREPKLDDNDDAVDDPFTAKVEEYWNRDQI
ncbi:S-adenosyl-L-methionine-dependent methyltransferase [Pseudomassariella vexata]|uniref:S-adenosyl-L-methionine-dependent methyltransferase n=1 Tax=Pseudomassariella vexata TaxID=1141098 RepID=A0A1Y2E774_9PEZI|nr:S-adenosyl-L-methionine-dependent methyltransferase [Pseudomassariella vexata]ORY67184.1 S-adenosyl-L-methionine-dependent methyltransferase [Pseudomassariella vexata]